jgi:hypothetical protein
VREKGKRKKKEERREKKKTEIKIIKIWLCDQDFLFFLSFLLFFLVMDAAARFIKFKENSKKFKRGPVPPVIITKRIKDKNLVICGYDPVIRGPEKYWGRAREAISQFKQFFRDYDIEELENIHAREVHFIFDHVTGKRPILLNLNIAPDKTPVNTMTSTCCYPTPDDDVFIWISCAVSNPFYDDEDHVVTLLYYTSPRREEED